MAKMFSSFWDFVTGTNRTGPLAVATILPYDYTELYQRLYDLYNNDTGLSDEDSTRRLRTVVNRSVEFYATKLLPGKEMSVIAQEDRVKAAVELVIKDSNFTNNKGAMLRGFALYGDSFVRVSGDQDTTTLADVSPFYVTDFDEDDYSELTFIRIDIPTLTDDNLPALYTEYWDLDTQTFRQWLTTRNSTTPIKELGTPAKTLRFSSFGITKIPIIHSRFRDNGDLRGVGCVYHALDKIVEANRVATRLHDLLFRFDKPIWVASANDKDAAGRPLPPPKINTSPTGDATAAEGAKESIFGDVVSLPGVASLNALVPDVNYADALAILQDHMRELENDLPELRWYSLNATERAAMSGTALRTLLGAAIDRAQDAKNNFLASLHRMLKLAIQIGEFNGMEEMQGLGDPEALEFELSVDDAWGQSVDEKAATMKALTEAGVPARAAMKLAGFTDEQVDEAFSVVSQPPPELSQMPPGRIVAGAAPKAGVQVVRVN